MTKHLCSLTERFPCGLRRIRGPLPSLVKASSLQLRRLLDFGKAYLHTLKARLRLVRKSFGLCGDINKLRVRSFCFCELHLECDHPFVDSRDALLPTTFWSNFCRIVELLAISQLLW